MTHLVVKSWSIVSSTFARAWCNFVAWTGNPVVFEWKVFPGHTTTQLLLEVAEKNDEIKIQPHDFKDRIIFLSTYNDIDWTTKNNRDICLPNSSRVSAYARDFDYEKWCVSWLRR